MNSSSKIIIKILSIFESGLFIKILSVFITGLWIAGLILANIYIIILAVVLLVALSSVLYVHRDNLKEIFQSDSNVIVEDERTQLINEKAATMTLGSLIAVMIYVGIIIVALRNSYPQFLQAGYTLFAVVLSCFILYFASRAYYTHKY
jgi:Predicted membrane protein